ncbi:MAG TPA: hypothetical protein VJY54_12545 [Lachnospiraceae bacterium]|nr:hypothetical protein [Lachnospiraceae bacterium]
MRNLPDNNTRANNHALNLVKKCILLTALTVVVILAIYFLVPDYLQKVAWGLSILFYIILLLRMILSFLIRSKKNGFHIIVNIIYLIVASMAFIIIVIQVLAPSVMFYTYFAEDAYCDLMEVPTAEEITIQTEQGILSGWFLHNADKGAPLILYFGGNAENSATRILRLVNTPEDLETFSGYNIAFIDYPGYGKSDGSPTDTSLKQYGLTVYDTLAARDDVSDIIVFAFSIGTGVGNYVSFQRPVHKLILFAPYADGVDLYNNYLNVFYGPLKSLVTYHMEAVKYAESIQVAPLIIASKTDKIVSYKSSVRLSEAYPLGNRFITLEGIGHNDIWKTPSVLMEVKKYLSEE